MYVLSRNMKKKSEFLSKIFQLLEVKFSIYLNRRVFVMDSMESAKSRFLVTQLIGAAFKRKYYL